MYDIRPGADSASGEDCMWTQDARRQITTAPDGAVAPWRRTIEPKGDVEGDGDRATATRDRGGGHLRPLRTAARHQGARGAGHPDPALRRLLLGAGAPAAGPDRHAARRLNCAMQHAIRHSPDHR